MSPLLHALTHSATEWTFQHQFLSNGTFMVIDMLSVGCSFVDSLILVIVSVHFLTHQSKEKRG